MSVDQLIQLIFGAGFPAGVAVYLLVRLGPVLEKMTAVMTRVEKVLDRVEPEKATAPSEVHDQPTAPLRMSKTG